VELVLWDYTFSGLETKMGKVKSFYYNDNGDLVDEKRDYAPRRKDHWLDGNYRRGYHQGYSQAIDDHKWGKGVIKFFNNKLTKWRYGKPPFKPISEMELPPDAK